MSIQSSIHATTCIHRYRRTKVDGLADLVDVVNASSTVNTAQLVGSPDGTVIVPTYDWQTFLGEHLNKLVGIKSFHHLRFSSQHKGSVFVKLRSDSPEVKYDLLKHPWTPTATDLPELVIPKGLSLQRQWYLFLKIAEFVSEMYRAITCPRPAEPEPPATSSSSATRTSSGTGTSTTGTTTTTTSTTTPALATATSSSTPTDSDTSAPPAKRPRLCGICRETGHNARSCPKK